MTIILRIPNDIALILNATTSRAREYQADRYAARLMNGVGISDFLDDVIHQEDHHGDTFTQFIMRSHPPSELRRDEIMKEAR